MKTLALHSITSYTLKTLGLALLLVLNQACCTGCDEDLIAHDEDVVADYMTNLQLENTVQVTGAPPVPNGNLSFSMQSNGYAFNNEGFDFTLTSEAEIVGLYLQITRGEAVSEIYLDLEVTKDSGKKATKAPTAFTPALDRRSKAVDKKGNTYEIDTDFAESLSTDPLTGIGSICYIIRVYDDSGNISEPQNICFDHYGWANDLAIAGLWDLTKYEERENGLVTSVAIAEVVCDDLCSSLDFKNILFSEDGSFELEIIAYEYEGQDINSFDRNQENYKGKWFFDGVKNTLVLAVYNFSSIENDNPLRPESLTLGNAEIITIPKVALLPNTTSPNEIILQYDDDYTEYYERPKTE